MNEKKDIRTVAIFCGSSAGADKVYAEGAEDRKGSIEVGKLADLVVWNDDISSVDTPEETNNLEALMTIVGGEIVAHSKDHVVYMPAVQAGQ